jgi:SnoaL-like domain
MDPNDDEELARRLLAELQQAVTLKRLDRVLQVFDTDLVVFGTAVANLDSEHSVAYLERVLDQPSPIRWEWDVVRPVARDEQVFCFAAIGSVGFAGDPDDDREPFRLTCVAVSDGSRWRLRHFHGSVPQT